MARKPTTRYDIIENTQSSSLKALDKQKSTTGWEKAHPADINHIVWNIVAKRRTGKSTLILNTLTKLYRNHFTTIYFISPTAEEDDKFHDLVESCKQTYSFFSAIDNETINNITSRLKEEIRYYNAKKKTHPNIECPKNLIIIDDCAGMMGPTSAGSNPLNVIYNNSAHLKLSVWTSVQTFRSLLPTARKNADMYSFFKIGNQGEFDAIVDEICIPKSTFIKSYAQVIEADPDDEDDDKDDDKCSAPFLHVHWLRKNNTGTLFSCYDRLDVPHLDLVTTQCQFTSRKDSYKKVSKFDPSGGVKNIYNR